jgi:hypothetical protein
VSVRINADVGWCENMSKLIGPSSDRVDGRTLLLPSDDSPQ